ncbi:Ig-like domain-containing protein, partial [Leisingera sp. S232]|uniref:Ig-like domain-containing protein n=1 Tax=Leisingera sp. S232 TaxID=3415132 RepID=UPI003C7CAB7A
AVTIDPVNDAPVAADDTGSTGFETAVTLDVLGNDTDVDGDPLTVTEATADNGTVTINADGTLEYTPDAGFDGDDTITYTISDGELTDTAEVAVTVEPDTDVDPVANPDTAEVDEGDLVTIDVLSNDTDPQGDPLTVVGADAPNGIVDINPDGTLSYEPDEGFTGEDTITYTVEDPDGNQGTSTVTVTVNEVIVENVDPVALDDVYEFDIEGYEGGNIRLTGSDDLLLANDTDADGDALRVIEANGDANLRQWIPADNGGEIRITSSGAVRFRDVDGDFANLSDGEVQSTSITYRVSDGQGGSDEAMVTVNVTGAAVVENQVPDAVDDTASVDAGNFVTIPVLANDTDPQGDPLTVVDADAPNGIVDINPDGTITYEPDEGFVGEDTITYTIEDPDGNSDTAEVTVVVNEGEQTPVVVGDTAETDEDTAVTIDVLSNDSDPNGDPLTVVEATAPNGTVTINPDGTLEYTPDPDFNGDDTITYTVEDPDGNSATGEVAVTIDPVNDAPVAADDTGSTGFETAVTLDVLGNDTDVDGDPLTVTEATADNGTVTINADGTLEYTPDAGFDGDDTITYTISDGELTDTAEVAVTVEPTDEVAPVAEDDTAETDEDTAVTIDVLSNDSDPNGDPLTVVEATAPNGTVT